MLNQLCQESPPFASFYGNETAVFANYTIRWFSDPDLPTGVYASTCINKDHSVTIELGNISPIDKPFMVAHELASLVLNSKGYPLISAKNTDICQTTGALLVNMINPLLRDSILVSYGIDVTRSYYTYQLQPFFNACGDPKDAIGQLQCAFSYVQLVLYWRDVLAHHAIPQDADVHFYQCFPKSWSKAQDILLIINKNGGYDTPAKEKAVFQQVIKKYKDELKGCSLCVP
jgi:hypothetical protein